MNSRTAKFRAIMLLAVSLLLSGCLGGNKIVQPDVQIKAENLLKRGIKAQSQNNAGEAERLFSEALALSSSIEDIRLMARTLINQARIYRLSQKLGKAGTAIDAALSIISDSAEDYAEAAHEKALLELACERTDTAEKWAGQAVSFEKGDDMGRRLNLLARTMLAGKNRTGALEVLNRALDKNRGQNSEEEANTLRMLGIAARESRDFNTAERYFSEALTIDKHLAISSKIAMDLEEMAFTCSLNGKPALAVTYLQRAYTVNLGAGRLEKAADNQLEIASIFSFTGDRESAGKALKTSREIAEKATNQTVRKSPETTNPSKRP